MGHSGLIKATNTAMTTGHPANWLSSSYHAYIAIHRYRCSFKVKCNSGSSGEFAMSSGLDSFYTEHMKYCSLASMCYIMIGINQEYFSGALCDI